MNIKQLIFSDDPIQALRIKRCLLSNKAYLIVATLAYAALHFGYLPNFPGIAIILVPLFANIIFYSLIRSGVNLYFSDPSLTVPQSIYAMLSYMFLIYFADEVRGGFLILLLVIPMSLTLRVRPKKLFWVSLLPLIIMGSIILWQQFYTEYQRDFFLGAFEWISLAIGAWWLTAEATYMARKRQEVKDSTRNLETALNENIVLVDNLTREKKIAEAANLSNLAKSKLIASANHDLRQPLHALNLFVAQLQSAKDENSRDKIIKNIDSCITGINELFESLMDISKLNADVSDPKLQNCHIQDIFDRLDNTFRDSAKQKGLRLIFKPTRLYVKSEPILLERILLNLINNALRYTEKGNILVGCRRRGDKVEIQVLDTGIGIRPEYQRRIFDEHFQVRNNENAISDNKGMGLGLAIVKKLCELLNHQIKLASEINKGTCFSVVIDRSIDITERTDYPLKTEAQYFNHKNIVIIDDDSLVLSAMEGCMTPWGCHIITAISGEDAITKLCNDNIIPNLIISDYSLSDSETGIDAINNIRKEFTQQIPAFLMSGNTDKDKIDESQAAGLTLLSKPIQPMIIRSLVAQYLAH